MAIIAIVQLVLHVLGWVCFVLSVIAAAFGNWDRALALFIGGVLWIGLKYLVGILYLVSRRGPS